MIEIAVRIKNLLFKQGLDDMRKQAEGFRKDVTKSFAGSLGGLIGGGAVVATFSNIIEKGGQIADLAARFGVSAEELQRIGNAAKQNGVELEAVGVALNKLALNQEKVRGGNEELEATLAKLGISAEEFINLKPHEAFYRLAEAAETAKDRQAAFGAVAELVGSKSTALFTTLEMGADAIRTLGDSVGIMSDESIARLDELGDAIDKSKNRFVVAGAGIMLWIDKVARSAGAVAGGMFGGGGAQAASEMVDEIWNPKEGDAGGERKPRTVIDPDAEGVNKKAAKTQSDDVAKITKDRKEAERRNFEANLDAEEKAIADQAKDAAETWQSMEDFKRQAHNQRLEDEATAEEQAKNDNIQRAREEAAAKEAAFNQAVADRMDPNGARERKRNALRERQAAQRQENADALKRRGGKAQVDFDREQRLNKREPAPGNAAAGDQKTMQSSLTNIETSLATLVKKVEVA